MPVVSPEVSLEDGDGMARFLFVGVILVVVVVAVEVVVVLAAVVMVVHAGSETAAVGPGKNTLWAPNPPLFTPH